ETDADDPLARERRGQPAERLFPAIDDAHGVTGCLDGFGETGANPATPDDHDVHEHPPPVPCRGRARRASYRRSPRPRNRPRGSDVLLRLHADAAVDTDRLRVHVAVRDQLDGERRELVRRAQPVREQDTGLEALLELLRALTLPVDGRVDESGRDGV